MSQTKQAEQTALPMAAPTLPEYLKSREGSTWTREDTVFVRTHVAQIERLAEDIVRRAKMRSSQ